MRIDWDLRMYKTCILGYLLILGTYTVHATEGGTGGASLTKPTANILHPLHGKKDYIKAVGATALNYGIATPIPTLLATYATFKTISNDLNSVRALEMLVFVGLFLEPALIVTGWHYYLLRSKLFFKLTRRLHHSSPKLYYGTAGMAGYVGAFITLMAYFKYGPKLQVTHP